MKLLILCVDGLDPVYATKLGYPKMPYENKLDIPLELCDENGSALTTLVWPSIFTGKAITELPKIPLSKIMHARLSIRKFIHNIGIKWTKKPKTSIPLLCPVMGEKTILDSYHAFRWNLPRISLEFAYHFPSNEDYIKYSENEYNIWKVITHGVVSYPYDIAACYCRILDAYGHNLLPLNSLYLDIHQKVRMLSKYCSIMLVSDHGCVDGKHTKHAYIGCTEYINASSVLDVSDNIGRILDEKRKIKKEIPIKEDEVVMSTHRARAR